MLRGEKQCNENIHKKIEIIKNKRKVVFMISKKCFRKEFL